MNNFKSMKKYIIILLLLSCNDNYKNNQLNLILPGDPKSLDPIYASDVRSGQICSLLYDTLIQFGDSVNIIPGIAEAWKISEKGKKYRFKLKNNVFFHNGKKVLSEDIKQAFTRISNPDNLSSFDWIFNNVKGQEEYLKGNKTEISGFVAENDSIFIIELNQIQNSFLYYLAMPPTSIVLCKPNKIIGTGPWKLKERVIDGHLLFDRNQKYFNTAPKIEQLKIRILPETFPRVAEFLTGYLDIMEIPENEYKSWAKKEKNKENIFLQNDLNTYYVGLNCSKFPFNNKKIRQAVNYAIDKNLIIQNVLNGRARVASGSIPPELHKKNKEKEQIYTYNIEKAKRILKEENIDQPIKIELWQSKSQKNSLITEIIQAQLKKINIEVKIIRRDWNMFTQAIRENRPDMYYRSWYADYPDAENFISPLFESTITKKRWNRYQNQEIDQIIALIEKENDRKRRNDLIERANDIIINDAPWIFLWHSQTAYIKNEKIKNWRPKTMYNAEKYNLVKK